MLSHSKRRTGVLLRRVTANQMTSTTAAKRRKKDHRSLTVGLSLLLDLL